MTLLKEKAKRTITRYNMLSPGDTVLIGVSGGPDSMALLYLLNDINKEYTVKIKVAHLNHGFRKEAAEEAEFVKKAAASLGLPAIIKSIDVPSIKERENLSAQEAARKARYAFFEEAASDAGANKVALAHTADDQAETVLMRLIRGSGPLGLSGIPPVRDMSGDCPYLRAACRRIGTVPGTEVTGQEAIIIRPLIDCSRKDVEEYISENDISYVIDNSNLKMDYMRNRVRMELIPFLEGYNPNIKETLIRVAEISHRDNQFLEARAWEAFASCQGSGIGGQGNNEGIAIAFKVLKDLHPALLSRILRKAIMTVKG
ncbi:MAG: tRNA lysidine(34) synthetase TilS, partial [Deltaproteobacteria bacterium]